MAAAARFAAVETALREGRHAQAAGLLDAALKGGARPPVELLLQVGTARFNAGDALAGEAWARRGLTREPRHPSLLFCSGPPCVGSGASTKRSRRYRRASPCGPVSCRFLSPWPTFIMTGSRATRPRRSCARC